MKEVRSLHALVARDLPTTDVAHAMARGASGADRTTSPTCSKYSM